MKAWSFWRGWHQNNADGLKGGAGGACVDAAPAGQLIEPYSLISFHRVCLRAKDVRHYGRCIYACNLHPPLISSSPSSLHRHRYDCAPVFQMFTRHLMLESGTCFFLMRRLCSSSKWSGNQKKKKKQSRRHPVYPVPNTKYGYAFEAPLKCKETQAACSLRRLNRASLYLCVRGAC